MKKGLIVILVLLFSFGIVLQQAGAIGSTGKITTKWGEVKSKALEKSGKAGDPVLVMSEDGFAIAVRRYLSENQNSGVQLAPLNIPVGSYAFGIDFEYPGHPLGACVYQKVPHLNIHVSKNGREVYNIHLGVYKDTSTGKFTIVFFGQDKVNTKKPDLCKQLSFPSLKNLKTGFDSVKNFIEDDIKSMNANLGYALPAIAITAAAYVIATAVFSMLVPLLI